MVLHIGGGYFVDTSNVLGIFDLETLSPGSPSLDFLRAREEGGEITDATQAGIPKSFIVCPSTVYLCEMSVSTLRKRLAGGEL